MNEPRFAPVLWRVGWQTLKRHPWQSALMLLGIMLGVAVVVGIDLANTSASRAFDLSVESIAGRATHQIVGPPLGFDEEVYVELRATGLREAAPVISETVVVPELGGRTLQLLGVDPFAEGPFRDYLVRDGAVPIDLLTGFLSQPGALLISQALADHYGLAIGDPLTLTIAGRTEQAFVAGLLAPADDLSRRAIDGLLLADIATAQELTGRLGRLDRIDLILPQADPGAVERIRAGLPEGLQLLDSGARSGAVAEMTGAFRTNLLALSLLALVVGVFLIYNTMTFSVVQRRPLFGTLRCLGVTRLEVFGLVMAEAAIVGTLGSLLGVGLGLLLGQGAVQAVSRTINDLFFVLTVQSVSIPLDSLAKGLALGIVTTLLAAAPPAWEAAAVPPRAALSRAGLEEKARAAVKGVAVAGLIMALAGAGLLLAPLPGLAISFSGTFAVIVGMAMLTPFTLEISLGALSEPAGRWVGLLGRMAPRGVVRSLSRTSIAVAALMVAVSVTIGISVMVGSFRNTVVIWLGQTLQGDVYINVPGGTQVSPSGLVDPAVVAALENWPGVARVDSVRAVDVDSPLGPVHIVAIENPAARVEQSFLETEGDLDALWARMDAGEAVTISEPFARRFDLWVGDTLTLYSAEGERSFQIAGVYYDYGRVAGTVSMSAQVYQALWRDEGITALALRLDPGQDPDAVAEEVATGLAQIQTLNVRANRALRDDVLVVFDQTFAITGALNVLATLVAFVGILSALLSIQLERGRELGILRAIGFTAQQAGGLVLLETGLMGLVAGLLSWPTGYALSLILVYIINRRSFGWTLQMLVEPGPFLWALVIAVSAALLAGLYPAWRMGRMLAAEALRFE